MAYGISAFYILTNENVNLISIDPFQSTQWNNYGVNLLKEFKHRNLIVKCLLDKDKNLKTYTDESIASMNAENEKYLGYLPK
jgi:hypothetical protein